MEKIESTICFEYYLSDKPDESDDVENETNYIVAEYAVENCQWLSDQSVNQKGSTTQKPQQKQWRGYAILEPTDVVQTPLFDQNLILDRPRRGATTTQGSNKKSNC